MRHSRHRIPIVATFLLTAGTPLWAQTDTPQRTVRNRITWTREGPDNVRQLWEVTEDGTSWRVVFNGLYRRADGAATTRVPRHRS